MIKKGDIIKVRPDLEPWKTYDGVVYTNNIMPNYAGQKAIITEVFIVHKETDISCYRLQFYCEEKRSPWCWSEIMLLPNESKISIY